MAHVAQRPLLLQKSVLREIHRGVQNQSSSGRARAPYVALLPGGQSSTVRYAPRKRIGCRPGRFIVPSVNVSVTAVENEGDAYKDPAPQSTDNPTIDEDYTATYTVTMPPAPMNGVRTDLSNIDLATLVEADSMYNHELSWMSFNWR
eukprot:1189885-Pyramimonas_sp.AAC.1